VGISFLLRSGSGYDAGPGAEIVTLPRTVMHERCSRLDHARRPRTDPFDWCPGAEPRAAVDSDEASRPDDGASVHCRFIFASAHVLAAASAWYRPFVAGATGR
jgi:hypothetical protein